MKNYKDTFSRKDHSIKKVLEIINKGKIRASIIVDDEERLLGIVADGDIRRAILRNIDLNTKIEDIMIVNPYVAKKNVPREEIFALMKKNLLDFVPILDDNKRVIDIITIKDLTDFNTKLIKSDSIVDTPVKKVLIIGGAGYSGSVLTRKLLNEKYSVTVLDNLTYGENSIADLYDLPNFTFIKGDIRDIQCLLENLIDFDVVIHLAAIVGDAACQIDPKTSEETNFISTKLIAEICKYRKIPRLIFASTCSVYGASDNLLSEESAVNPLSIYAQTKLQSENELIRLADKNFSPCIFRIATIFGPSPRMRFDLVINTLTARAIKDRKIPIFSGEQWRPNIHIEDLARAYILCIKAPRSRIHNQILNVGGNALNSQIIEIGKIIKKLVPEANLEVHKKKFDERNYKVNFNKIEKLLGFKPLKTIEDGVNEIIELFNQNKISNYKDKRFYNAKSFELGTLKGLYFEN
ncbi:MAG: NAD-dependent epimerase/dehydratase family protein [Candidatus Helarchaeota archaeon]